MTTQPIDTVDSHEEFDEDTRAEMLSHLGDLEHYSTELDAALKEYGFSPLGVDSDFYGEASTAAFDEAQRTRGAHSLSEIMGYLLADIQMLRERMAPRETKAPADFYDWIGIYKPVMNHFRPCAPLGGFMFETFGEELAYVNNWPADQIWTFVSGDGGDYIISGAHFVNRLGYLLTSVSTNKGDEDIEIKIA